VSHLELNLRALRLHHPEIDAGTLEGLSRPAESVKVEATPSGCPTALYRDAHVHSRYDPRKEAAALVAREAAEDATAGIILGFGLGYAAEAFRQRYPELPLLIVEPEADFFRAALGSRDLVPLLSSPGLIIHLAAPAHEVSRALERLPLDKPRILRLRPVLESDPGSYRTVEEMIRAYLLRRDININTLNRFGRLWVRNLAANMRDLLECPGVSCLEGAFQGIPALLLAGGPSLDEVLPDLPQLARRMLVVAVDTPLRACLEAGVKPDFVVMVDPQYWATRYLDWTEGYDGFIVAEPSTHPRVFRGPPRRIVLSSSLFPLGVHLESVIGAKGRLGAGGSVSTSAWDLCRLLGAGAVYTAGLDLGFPGARTHCAGAFFEQLWLAVSERTQPAEGRAFRSLREIGVFRVPSNGGGQTLTDRRMLLYKWWFESQIASPTGVPTYTLSEKAVAITGMPLAARSELLGLPEIRPLIQEMLAGACRRADAAGAAGPGAQAAAERLAAAVRGMVESLRRLEELGREGLSCTLELERVLARRGDPRALLGRLDGVDAAIIERSTRDIAGFLIQPLIHSVVGAAGRRGSRAEVLSVSRRMYEGVRESAGFQAGILSRAAGRLASMC
jgi:hypothetical protein